VVVHARVLLTYSRALVCGGVHPREFSCSCCCGFQEVANLSIIEAELLCRQGCCKPAVVLLQAWLRAPDVYCLLSCSCAIEPSRLMLVCSSVCCRLLPLGIPE
jgi:hypothetical protein